MFNVRPDALSPWLYVEPPPADEVPGFRMNPDGSVRDTPRAAPPGSFGFDPSARPSPSMGLGFQDAMRFAPGNVYPDAHLTGLSDFAPPPRHPLQDALGQITRIYAPFAPRPPGGPFVGQQSEAGMVSPTFGQPPFPNVAESQSPKPAVPFTSAWPDMSDGLSMIERPLGTPSNDVAQLDAGLAPSPAAERLRAPDDQGSPLPSTTGAAYPSAAFDVDTGAAAIPVNNVQIAQAPSQPQRRQSPSASPMQQRPEPPASEQRLQVKATQRFARASTWEDVIRQTLPEKIDPRFQQPLPDDWEAALTKKDPNYLKWTKAAAEQYGIPPELLARLIYKESTYNSNKVSGRGAKGIAQLMPKAVEDLGFDPRTFDYFNAEKSIDASAALLAKYYRHFKDWPKTVAAYNWGIGNLHNWLEGDRSAGPNDETQTTLKHVFRGNPQAFNKGP
jgi:soluble lytic murein transglycosylase-like protein